MALVPTIAVDFDGTLCDHEFPGIGAIKPYAREAMVTLKQWGYHIIIWTCRTCHFHYDVFGGDPAQPTLERPAVKQMIAWLDKNGIPYDEVDDGSRGKPLADYYLDDKAIRYENNWPEILAKIGGLNSHLIYIQWMMDQKNLEKGDNV